MQSFKLEKPEQTNPKTAKILAGAVLLGLIVLGIYAISSVSHQLSNAKPAPTQHVSATPKSKAVFSVNTGDTQFAAVNPADLKVSGSVTNKGTAPAKPTCSIDAHDASRSYSGIDALARDQPLQPGEIWYFQADITVTHQGAPYVTAVDIQCD